MTINKAISAVFLTRSAIDTDILQIGCEDFASDEALVFRAAILFGERSENAARKAVLKDTGLLDSGSDVLGIGIRRLSDATAGFLAALLIMSSKVRTFSGGVVYEIDESGVVYLNKSASDLLRFWLVSLRAEENALKERDILAFYTSLKFRAECFEADLSDWGVRINRLAELCLNIGDILRSLIPIIPPSVDDLERLDLHRLSASVCGALSQQRNNICPDSPLAKYLKGAEEFFMLPAEIKNPAMSARRSDIAFCQWCATYLLNAALLLFRSKLTGVTIIALLRSLEEVGKAILIHRSHGYFSKERFILDGRPVKGSGVVIYRALECLESVVPKKIESEVKALIAYRNEALLGHGRDIASRQRCGLFISSVMEFNTLVYRQEFKRGALWDDHRSALNPSFYDSWIQFNLQHLVNN